MVVPIGIYRRRHMHRSPLSILIGMLVVFLISGVVILIKSDLKINVSYVMITIGIVLVLGFVIIFAVIINSARQNRERHYNGEDLYRQRSPIQQSSNNYYFQDNEVRSKSAEIPMFCNACGERLSQDAAFCTKCGARIRGMSY